jgi:hypothetical protein
VAPTALDGVDGDFYFDTVTKTMYGPKAAGTWPVGTNLTGPQGVQGIQGVQGPTGTMGPGIEAFISSSDPVLTAVLLGGTDIAFPGTNTRTYGSGGPSYLNGVFTLPAGTYRVSYAMTTTAGLLMQTRLVLNGTPVAGSEAGGALAVTSFHGQALVTASAGSTLSLQYFGLLAAATSDNGSIIIEKVA